MDLHNFDHNVHHANVDHTLQADLDSSSQMEISQPSSSYNPVEQDYLNSHYSHDPNSLLEQQQFDVSQSSLVHETFETQHLDANNVHQSSNLLDTQNLENYQVQTHELHQSHLIDNSYTNLNDMRLEKDLLQVLAVIRLIPHLILLITKKLPLKILLVMNMKGQSWTFMLTVINMTYKPVMGKLMKMSLIITLKNTVLSYK